MSGEEYHGPKRQRGRGALSQPAARFEPSHTVLVDDGWGGLTHQLEQRVQTQVLEETSRSVITRNASPDLPFDASLNPYKGCEHGCVYCYARPSHAYLGMSPGLDFETKIVSKPDAASVLRKELCKPGYQPQTIVVGANTDPYQPIERRLKITRSVIETLWQARHPVALITKSAGILRDLDLLTELSQNNLVSVSLSITTLDSALASRLEPRASTPERRLDALRRLSAAGIPTTVLWAPVIPALNDAELEQLVARCAETGAHSMAYILLRLPREIKQLFAEWLNAHYPDRAGRVLSLIRQTRGGALYQSEFGTRMRGTGPYADLLSQRFRAAQKRAGLDRPLASPDTTQFDPSRLSAQLALW